MEPPPSPARKSSSEARPEARFSQALLAIWKYALEKPAAIVSILYIYVSLVGLLYNVSYFYWFNINVVQFYDVTDFILACLRNPPALLVPIITIFLLAIVGMVVLVFDRAIRKWTNYTASRIESTNIENRGLLMRGFIGYDRFAGRFHEKTKGWADPNVIPFFSLLGLILSVFIIFLIATWNYAGTKDGDEDYCVYLGNMRNSVFSLPVKYVGSIQSMYFFWNPSTNSVDFIPQRAVTRITRIEGPSDDCPVNPT